MDRRNDGSDPREDLTSSPPRSLIEKALATQDILEGQRRHATVLFTDMADYTPLAERVGEEKTYLLMRRVIKEMSEAVHAHEGTVQELTGDGLMALFGVPVAIFGSEGFEPPDFLQADQFFVRGVRLPFQKFLRNPEGGR